MAAQRSEADAQNGSAKPPLKERLAIRYPAVGRTLRALERYQQQRGDFFAAGITFYTVLAVIPMLMVGFSIAGFVLSAQPEMLEDLQSKITDAAPGEAGDTLVDVVDTAIKSRAAVGVIGLITATWTGLGWMSNLRAALTAQWDRTGERPNFLIGKLRDLRAMVLLGLAGVATMAISVIGSGSTGRRVADWLGWSSVPGIGVLITLVTIVFGVLGTWILFAVVIAKLPREPVGLHSALRAALVAAIVFEAFKRLGVVYIENVMSSPAGAAFGPVIGLMVFANITARILLMATAFAATSEESLAMAPVPVPDPAIIRPRMRSGPTARTRAAAAGTLMLIAGTAGWAVRARAPRLSARRADRAGREPD